MVYDEQDTLHNIGRTQVPTKLRREPGVDECEQEIVGFPQFRNATGFIPMRFWFDHVNAAMAATA